MKNKQVKVKVSKEELTRALVPYKVAFWITEHLLDSLSLTGEVEECPGGGRCLDDCNHDKPFPTLLPVPEELPKQRSVFTHEEALYHVYDKLNETLAYLRILRK